MSLFRHEWDRVIYKMSLFRHEWDRVIYTMTLFRHEWDRVQQKTGLRPKKLQNCCGTRPFKYIDIDRYMNSEI